MQKRQPLKRDLFILGGTKNLGIDGGLIYQLNIIFKRNKPYADVYWILTKILRGNYADNETTPWY